MIQSGLKVRELVQFIYTKIPGKVIDYFLDLQKQCTGADKSLARPGRKQATATQDF
jgi:hypothetical protein